LIAWLEGFTIARVVFGPTGAYHRTFERRLAAAGAKVAVAVTNREGVVIGMHAHAGHPYAGQTLAPARAQVERFAAVAPARGYVERGDRGHGVRGTTAVFAARRRRRITPTIRRELRSAIAAMIGHMKLDGRLGRNHLKGAGDDASHALLCGAGHNLRLILRHLARLLRALTRLLAALSRSRYATLQAA
jgi:IS5 family transposase